MERTRQTETATAVLPDTEDKVRASFPPSNQCLHPPQCQWLVTEQDVYQSPAAAAPGRTFSYTKRTRQTLTNRDAPAWHRGERRCFHLNLFISLVPPSIFSPTLFLSPSLSLMEAEKLQLIKDVNGGRE